MLYDHPASELVKRRFSSRSYRKQPIAADLRRRLNDFVATLDCGPLGTPARFRLAAASESDRQDLRNLGTYGFIRNPTGFIIGVVQEDGKGLEDFGYLMEQAVLQATDLGLGTCWLGGSFTRSGFAKKIAVQEHERLPAVTSVGYATSPDGSHDLMRKQVGGDVRKPWEELFCRERFGNPLTPEQAGAYAGALEAVRLGPSASNKQPWRVVKDGDAWHFYLQRTRGYRDNWRTKLLNVEDLQRVDLGIAMCHFELVAAELGLTGRWTVAEPGLDKPDDLTEYTVSWQGQ